MALLDPNIGLAANAFFLLLVGGGYCYWPDESIQQFGYDWPPMYNATEAAFATNNTYTEAEINVHDQVFIRWYVIFFGSVLLAFTGVITSVMRGGTSGAKSLCCLTTGLTGVVINLWCFIVCEVDGGPAAFGWDPTAVYVANALFGIVLPILAFLGVDELQFSIPKLGGQYAGLIVYAIIWFVYAMWGLLDRPGISVAFGIYQDRFTQEAWHTMDLLQHYVFVSGLCLSFTVVAVILSGDRCWALYSSRWLAIMLLVATFGQSTYRHHLAHVGFTEYAAALGTGQTIQNLITFCLLWYPQHVADTNKVLQQAVRESVYGETKSGQLVSQSDSSDYE